DRRLDRGRGAQQRRRPRCREAPLRPRLILACNNRKIPEVPTPGAAARRWCPAPQAPTNGPHSSGGGRRMRNCASWRRLVRAIALAPAALAVLPQTVAAADAALRGGDYEWQGYYLGGHGGIGRGTVDSARTEPSLSPAAQNFA